MKSHVQSLFLTPRCPPEPLFTRKKLGGLFVLERQEDGSIKAELSARLERRSSASYLGMQNSPESVNAHKAILASLKVTEMLRKENILFSEELPGPVILPDGSIERNTERENLNTRLVAFAFFVSNNLEGVFAPLKATKGEDLVRAIKRAKKIMCGVIEKLAHPLPSKADVREYAIFIPDLKCHLPLAVLAIEKARRLAGEHLRLPTKSEVREAIIPFGPDLADKRRDFWSELWREAMLDSLPKGKPVFGKQKGQLKNVAKMSGKATRK